MSPSTYTEVTDNKSANISIAFLPDIPGHAVAWAYLPYCSGFPCLLMFDESIDWEEGWLPGISNASHWLLEALRKIRGMSQYLHQRPCALQRWTKRFGQEEQGIL